MGCPYYIAQHVAVCIASTESPAVPSIVEIRGFCEQMESETCPLYRSLPRQVN